MFYYLYMRLRHTNSASSTSHLPHSVYVPLQTNCALSTPHLRKNYFIQDNRVCIYVNCYKWLVNYWNCLYKITVKLTVWHCCYSLFIIHFISVWYDLCILLWMDWSIYHISNVPLVYDFYIFIPVWLHNNLMVVIQFIALNLCG